MTKVIDIIRAEHQDGDVGIEIEMEGENLPKRGTALWHVEHDGSLRGEDNAEYVLRKPVPFADVELALEEIVEDLSDSTLLPSTRTGVHVHVNVQQLDLVQLATFITLYLVVEDLLLEAAGEHRQSNLFCLKGCEAEYMVQHAAKFFETGDLDYIANDSIRYSGINLAAIAKYGSVEFRSLRTPDDIMSIAKWVRAFKNMKDLSVERYKNPIDVLTGFSEFDGVLFLERVLPEYAKELMQVDGWESKLKRGMRSAQDLAFSQDWTNVTAREVNRPAPPAPPIDMKNFVPEDHDDLMALIERYNHIPRDHIIEVYLNKGRG
tara:strand:- start:527 stop:1486 length:960 start_codon:yes stop_codon:yes gene_type:complete